MKLVFPLLLIFCGVVLGIIENQKNDERLSKSPEIYKSKSGKNGKVIRNKINKSGIKIKDGEEFRKMRQLHIQKRSRCKLPARSHDSETKDMATRLRSKLQIGLSEFIRNEGKYCHKNKRLQDEIDIEAREVYKEKRRRRSIEEEYGSDVIIVSSGCKSKGTEEDDTLNMCHECQYEITFSDEYIEYDRHQIVKLCDSEPDSVEIDDFSCMMGEATCMEQRITRNLLKKSTSNSQSSSSNGVSGYDSVAFSFTTGCSCQIRKNSLFKDFVA